MKNTETLQAAIIGASGYGGVELVKILLRHPHVEINCVMGLSTVGKRIDDIYPYFRQKLNLEIEPYDLTRLKDIDIVFLALPYGKPIEYVPELLENGKRVIDFSGDFRLKTPEMYEEWYNIPHTAGEYLEKAVYGLPELFREDIRTAQLVANPGCYPTGAILALAPLLTPESLKTTRFACDSIAITALSGTSGAGRKEKLGLIFSEVNESVKAYRVGNHQHTPEIKTILERVAERELNILFIPHLVPITRGIYTTVCFPYHEGIDPEALLHLYEEFYREAPFVRVFGDHPPELKFVTGTNYCDVSVTVDKTKQFLVVNAAIDNLVKGAAGQAVQNMNLMFGFPENEGL
jgi:N-acetyl-gamma-glutamyl-phosphate reductase